MCVPGCWWEWGGPSPLSGWQGMLLGSCDLTLLCPDPQEHVRVFSTSLNSSKMPVKKHSQHMKLFKNKGKDETVSTHWPVPALLDPSRAHCWQELMERLLKVHGPKSTCVREQGNGSGSLQLGCLGGFWDVMWGWLGCKECGGTGKGDVSFGWGAVGWEMAQLQPAELSTAVIPEELGLVWDVRCGICQLDLSQ